MVIACYNDAAFVGGAIASAVAQDYPAVEVVVVDDGSVDNSAAVVAGFGERVRLLRLEANVGLAGARNRGVAVATGRWLMFLDADDFIAANTIAAMVEVARDSPGAVVACPWEFRERSGDEWLAVEPQRPFAPEGDPLRGWLAGQWVPTCALLYPAAVVAACGGFDETLRRNEDGDLACRAFAAGVQLVRTQSGRGHYVRHGPTRERLSSDVQSRHALWSQARVLDKLSAALAAQGRFEEYRPLLAPHYSGIARLAFAAGEDDIARACVAAGGPEAERRVRSPTRIGRIAERVLGRGTKHRLAAWVRRLRREPGGGWDARHG